MSDNAVPTRFSINQINVCGFRNVFGGVSLKGPIQPKIMFAAGGLIVRLQLSIWLLIVCFGCPIQFSFAQDKSEQKEEEKQDEPTLQERLQAVGRLAQSGDPEEALEMLKEIQADHADNIMVAVNLMNMLQQVGIEKASDDRSSGNDLFYEAGKLARKFKDKAGFPRRFQPLIATCIYNEACTYAIDGKKEEALKSLQEAFDVGFEDLELAQSDSDFGDLLETKEFKAIIDGQKKKIEEAERLAEQKRKDALVKSIKDFESYEFDFDLKDVDGKDIKKADFQGKFLIVDLWGTWCPPCRREIPSFIKLKKNYGDKMDVVGLAYERADDDDEARERVKEFMEDKEMNYRCALGTDEVKDQLPDMRGYPTTLFLDESGEVRMEVTGLLSYEYLELILKTIMDDKS